MPKSAASKLASGGMIRIGNVGSRVWERVFEQRYYKCGATRHFATRCTDTENAGKCFRCGNVSHFTVECSKETGKNMVFRDYGKERKNSEEK